MNITPICLIIRYDCISIHKSPCIILSSTSIQPKRLMKLILTWVLRSLRHLFDYAAIIYLTAQTITKPCGSAAPLTSHYLSLYCNDAILIAVR